MRKNLITILITLSAMLAALVSACSSSPAPVAGQITDVKRGDLNIVVSSDGNLEMPNQFDLKFGASGQVDQILVEEGDNVKQGALLATLVNSSQINAIKTALFNVQTAQNNITLGCDTDHLPYNYPDLSVSRMVDEAQKDIETAAGFYKQGNYKDAGYWLTMTYFDIQVCENLIKFRPNAAELAGAKNNSVWSPDVTAGGSWPVAPDNQAAIDYLQQYRGKLLDIARDMKLGLYDKITPAFDSARQEMSEVSSAAKGTLTIHTRMIYEYADTPTSVDFLQASLRYLEDLQNYMAEPDALAIEAAKKLYTAKLNLLVGRDVLENQTLIFESGGGINWKTLQQYNLSLQAAEISMYKAKQEIMKTAIIAPSDGSVVSVDLKKSYVLSAQDYSSKIAVKLVDTNTIRFKGTIDEIDIVKVKSGQPVSITVDAVPDRTFTGKVKFISPYGAAVGKVIKFTVLVEMDPADIQLRGGLRATAEIMASSVKDALLVPVSYIVSTPGGSMVMLVNSATGKAEPKRVTLGLQNFQYAEVTSGLSDGDKVQLPGKPASGPAAGQQRQQTGAGGNAMRVLH
jgi:multidrug efflux pump subunit AcrA (membrane-fusion protein)